VELKPNDRVIFGTGTVLLYRCQNRDSEVSMRDDPANPITYEFAMEEKGRIENQAEEGRKAREKAEAEAKAAAQMEALRVQMEAEKAEQERERQEMQRKMEEEMARLKAEIEAKQNDADAKQQAEEREAKLRIEMEFKIEQERVQAAEREKERQEKIRREEELIKLRQAENSALEHELERILPLVREANMIAAEFRRDIRFNTQLTSAMPDFGDLKAQKRVFEIKVDNREVGYFYIWTPEKFSNRVEMMREMFNEYVESGGQIPDFSDTEQDPFWDPPEPILIGKSFMQLKNLGYTLENEDRAPIFTTATNIKDGKAGELNCAYWPCDITGEEEPDDELLVDDPEELLNKEIFFRVEVKDAANLPKDLCKDAFVTYIFKHEPDTVYRVPIS